MNVDEVLCKSFYLIDEMLGGFCIKDVEMCSNALNSEI